MSAKKKKKPLVDESAGFGLNLGALLQSKGLQASGSPKARSGAVSSDESRVQGDEHPSVDFSSCGKLVLQHERKGRSGKTVTVIRGFTCSDTQLRDVAQRMRRALGCGAGVEQVDRIVLQGDQLERARLWLEQQGALQVVLGTRPKR